MVHHSGAESQRRSGLGQEFKEKKSNLTMAGRSYLQGMEHNNISSTPRHRVMHNMHKSITIIEKLRKRSG